MPTVKANRVSLPGLAEATDEDRAWWLGRAEFCRENPDYLKWLRKENPEAYEFTAAGLRVLRIEAKSQEWRVPGIGGRAEQLIPGTDGSFSERTDWSTWLLVGGRGSGKSRTGAEAVREMLFGRAWATNPRVALVGQTLESVRIDMVEKTLLEVVPASSVIQWNRGTCELWLDLGNGRTAFLKGYSSDAPRKLRGPNFHLAWADEIATWTDADRSPNAPSTTWSNMRMAVRMDDLGSWVPRVIATTTPKSTNLIRNFDSSDPENPGQGVHDDDSTVISAMSTLENAENLSADFMKDVIGRLEGTRLYDQEVLGILMDAAIGAQWTDELIREMTRRASYPEIQGQGLKRVVVAVDPSIGSGLGGDECGIVVAGLGFDGVAYVLEDASLRAGPSIWCQTVVEVYERWGADSVIAEINQGGDLVEEALGRHAPSLPLRKVWAKRNKLLRAEPVALLSDQGRCAFAGGPELFQKLQLQMKTWDGDGDSPDRLDAFVYAILHLIPPRAGLDDLMKTTRGNIRNRRRVGSPS